MAGVVFYTVPEAVLWRNERRGRDERAWRADLPSVFDARAYSGGGIRCIAFVGAIRALERARLRNGVRRVVGTSGGGLVALMDAAELPAARMEDLVMTTDFTRLCDASSWSAVEAATLLRWGGVNTGVAATCAFGDWVHRVTGLSRDATFDDLARAHPDVELAIVATSLATLRPLVFSMRTGHAQTPLRIALRASASIPYFFAPVTASRDGKVVDTLVDGGLVDNLPVHAFCAPEEHGDDDQDADDANGHCCRNTLAFLLDALATAAPPSPMAEANTVYSDGLAVSHAAFAAANADAAWLQMTRGCLRGVPLRRVVSVPPPGDIATAQFALCDAQRRRLLDIGDSACSAYLVGLGALEQAAPSSLDC